MDSGKFKRRLNGVRAYVTNPSWWQKWLTRRKGRKDRRDDEYLQRWLEPKNTPRWQELEASVDEIPVTIDGEPASTRAADIFRVCVTLKLELEGELKAIIREGNSLWHKAMEKIAKLNAEDPASDDNPASADWNLRIPRTDRVLQPKVDVGTYHLVAVIAAILEFLISFRTFIYAPELGGPAIACLFAGAVTVTCIALAHIFGSLRGLVTNHRRAVMLEVIFAGICIVAIAAAIAYLRVLGWDTLAQLRADVAISASPGARSALEVIAGLITVLLTVLVGMFYYLSEYGGPAHGLAKLERELTALAKRKQAVEKQIKAVKCTYETAVQQARKFCSTLQRCYEGGWYEAEAKIRRAKLRRARKAHDAQPRECPGCHRQIDSSAVYCAGCGVGIAGAE